MNHVPASVEERTRVVCSLVTSFSPENDYDADLVRACQAVINYVETLEKYDYDVGGYTLSRSNAFNGRWISIDGEKEGEWIKNDIVLLFIDYRLSANDGSVWVKLSELRKEVEAAYRLYGVAQQEVWILAHPVFRQKAT